MSTEIATSAPKSVHVDYALVAQEFLAAARGRRHSSTVSQRLGFTFDQVKRWERGTTRCLWPDFLRLAGTYGLRVKAALEDSLSYRGPADDVRRLVEHLLAGSAVGAIATKLHLAPATLRRWLNGKQSPSLANMLGLMAVVMRRMDFFLTALVPAASLPSLRGMTALLHAERDLHYRHPYAAAVVRALETNLYAKHRGDESKLLAAITGLSAREVRVSLGALRAAGLVVADPGGKLVLKSLARIDIVANFAGEQRIILYWLKRAANAAKALKARPTRHRMGYQVFNCSEETFGKIRAATTAYFHQVRQLLEADAGPPDVVALASCQLLDLADVKGER